MNEWGYIGNETLLALGESAAMCKFKKGVALGRWKGQCFLIPTHHSLTLTLQQPLPL